MHILIAHGRSLYLASRRSKYRPVTNFLRSSCGLYFLGFVDMCQNLVNSYQVAKSGARIALINFVFRYSPPS